MPGIGVVRSSSGLAPGRWEATAASSACSGVAGAWGTASGVLDALSASPVTHSRAAMHSGRLLRNFMGSSLAEWAGSAEYPPAPGASAARVVLGVQFLHALACHVRID